MDEDEGLRPMSFEVNKEAAAEINSATGPNEVLLVLTKGRLYPHIVRLFKGKLAPVVKEPVIVLPDPAPTAAIHGHEQSRVADTGDVRGQTEDWYSENSSLTNPASTLQDNEIPDRPGGKTDWKSGAWGTDSIPSEEDSENL